MTARRALLVLIGALVVGGAGVFGWGAWQSKQSTGEWMGYPLPDAAVASLGIGALTAGFGLVLLLAYAVASLAERRGVRRVLTVEVLPDDHPLTRIGRRIIRGGRAIHGALGVLVLLIVFWVAMHSMVAAAILGALAAAVALRLLKDD